MTDVPLFDRIWPASARRTLTLSALGALAGLAAAGYGLFTAQGTRSMVLPPANAAMVNAVPILRADLVQQVEAATGRPYQGATRAEKQRVLSDMIREELYVQHGIETGLASDDSDVRAALVRASEAQVAEDVQATRPSPTEMRAWYDAHRDRYAGQGRMQAQDWLVPADRDPAALAAALRRGTAPAALGLVSAGTMDDGEEFYFAARIHLGAAAFVRAAALHDGQVTDPVQVAGRWHIVRMIHNSPPRAPDFDAVQDKVMQDLITARAAQVQDGMRRFLTARADIQVAGDLQ